MAHFTGDLNDIKSLLMSYKETLGYTEEEIENITSRPNFMKYLSIMPTPEVRNSTMVWEVIESHGCAEGMKKGDKLYFTGMSLLDPKRSDPWCAYALSEATALAFSCHNLILNGVDPNLMYSNCFSCFDCGSKHGGGQVVMRAKIIREDLENTDESEAVTEE